MSKVAIQGDYCDIKFIKSRKVAVICIEIPIEAAGEFVNAFGTPLPDRTVPVAIARLVPDTGLKEKVRESVEHEKSKRNWDELSRAQQAGIACNEKGFWRFLDEAHPYLSSIWNAEAAAEAVRSLCGVASRKDLDSGEASHLWDSLYDGYRVWLQAPDVAA